MMRYMVMIGIGVLSIVMGVVAFFLVAAATRKAILEVIVIDSTSHKKYDAWKSDWGDGAQTIYQKFSLYNLTNPEEFATGKSKAVFAEVGPFVYRRYGNNTNVAFGDGGNEVSYNEHVTYIFQPNMSVSDDQETMILNINPFYVKAIAKSGGSEYDFFLAVYANYKNENLTTVKQALFASMYAAGAHQALTKRGVGAKDWLLYRSISARAHIFGPDPLALLKNISAGYFKNNTLDDWRQSTVKTGKSSSSVAGMDYFTQRYNIRTSTAYQNAEGVGPAVVVSGRTRSLDPFQDATPDKIDLYLWQIERLVPFIFNGVQEVEGIETARYVADVKALVKKSEKWNITHAGFAPMQYWAKGIPFFASLPHQLGADGLYAEKITGQSYSPATHSSYLLLEPTTGLPLEARLALGFNLQMNFTATSYFDAPKVTKKDLMVPLHWMERSYRINPETAVMLRMAVVTAVVVRRAILGSLVGLGVVCVLIGAALMAQKGCSKGVSGEGKDGGANEKKQPFHSPLLVVRELEPPAHKPRPKN